MPAAAYPPPGGGGEWVHLFRADPQLAAELPAETLHAAMPYAFARIRWLEAGRWSPEREPPVAGDLGLLVLDGFVMRQVHVLDRPCTELLGPGDLLRPWEPAHTEPFSAGVRWEALEPVRLAVLDRRLTAVLGRWPELIAAVVGRAVARSRELALNLAIGQIVGIELRLLVVLWRIAQRWGAREAGGVVLPVHLPHHLLASLAAARRPTVTRALGQLTEQNLVSRRSDGLLVLHGAPPNQFRRLQSALP